MMSDEWWRSGQRVGWLSLTLAAALVACGDDGPDAPKDEPAGGASTAGIAGKAAAGKGGSSNSTAGQTFGGGGRGGSGSFADECEPVVPVDGPEPDSFGTGPDSVPLHLPDLLIPGPVDPEPIIVDLEPTHPEETVTAMRGYDDGTLYVVSVVKNGAAVTNHRLTAYDRDFSRLWRIEGPALPRFRDVGVAPGGNPVLATDDSVSELDAATGDPIWSGSDNKGGIFVAVAPDDSVRVATLVGMSKYDADGVLEWTLLYSELGDGVLGLSSLAVDSAGSVYAVSPAPSPQNPIRVLKVAADGTVEWRLGDRDPFNSMYVDPDDGLLSTPPPEDGAMMFNPNALVINPATDSPYLGHPFLEALNTDGGSLWFRGPVTRKGVLCSGPSAGMKWSGTYLGFGTLRPLVATTEGIFHSGLVSNTYTWPTGSTGGTRKPDATTTAIVKYDNTGKILWLSQLVLQPSSVDVPYPPLQVDSGLFALRGDEVVVVMATSGDPARLGKSPSGWGFATLSASDGSLLTTHEVE